MRSARRWCSPTGARDSRNRFLSHGERPHHVFVLVLDDVAVVNISLRRGHAGRQIEFCSDPREVPGVDLDSILEARPPRRVGEIGVATGQAGRDGCRARLGDRRPDPDLHHLRQPAWPPSPEPSS